MTTRPSTGLILAGLTRASCVTPNDDPVNEGYPISDDGIHANANNDAQDGREWIYSDPYFALGLTAPWIGIRDTGVRETHDQPDC
jgi:hypothetical protein